MKLHSTTNRKARAFTLIEMIGVLAVIAILAALLIPKVFTAINDARINGAIVGVQTIKTAVIDSYGKNSRFDAANNAVINPFNLPYSGYDTNVLMVQGLIEKPFMTKVGTGTDVQVVAAVAANITCIGTGVAYALQGITAQNDATGVYVVQAVITGVAEADAQAMSQRIDGPTMSVAGLTPGTLDDRGRVTYAAPTSPGGPVTVYIHLANR
jgi:prepilin-type N-terminal cleavage/methylation domain-containing protein